MVKGYIFLIKNKKIYIYSGSWRDLLIWRKAEIKRIIRKGEIGKKLYGEGQQ